MSTQPGRVDESRRRDFERARLRSPEASIDEHLPAPDDGNFLATLEELVCIELEASWREWDGDLEARPLALEDWVQRYEVLRDPAILTRLVEEEYRVRHRFGDRPSTTSFTGRFPELGPDGSGALRANAELARVASERARHESAQLVGGSLGRYVLEEEVGSGSFARVFRATDPTLGRTVAVKVLRPEALADTGLVERFHQEARTAARLRHPGIVSVHEVGDDRGLPYLVAEFVDGPSFEDLLADRTPAPREAAEWVMRIAEALDYAHQFGVVHRDVKPANVLLNHEVGPQVTDFGLALWSEEDAGLTRHGELLGTPAYMAPEQARGGGTVDARSDVYGLGVVLYRMLTGRLPFAGSFHTILRQVIESEPPVPRRISPGTPRELEIICGKAMAKEPERRYASAGRMAEDLRRFLAHEPILAQPPGAFERAALWCRRKPSLALALAVILLITTIGSIAVLRERTRFRSELSRSLIGEARAEIRARDTGWWWNAWDRVRTAAELGVGDPEELRDIAIALHGTSAPSMRVSREWSSTAGSVHAVACRGAWTASGHDDGTIEVRDTASGEPVVRWAAHTGSVQGLRFTEAGLVSASRDGHVRTWRIEGGRAERIADLDLEAGGLSRIAVSRDLVAVGCEDGRIALLAPGQAPAFFVGHTAAVVDVSFTPDGSRLASASSDITIKVWDVHDRSIVESIHVFDRPSCVLATGPDTLFSASPATYGFRRFQVARPEAVECRNQVHSAGVRDLAQVGPYVVTAGGDGVLKLWNDSLDEVAFGEPGFSRVLAITPGDAPDQLIAGYEDGTVRIWEFGGGRHAEFWNATPTAFLADDAVVAPYGLRRDGQVLHYGPLAAIALATHPTDERFVVSRGPALHTSEGLVFGVGEATITALASDPLHERYAAGDEAGRVCVVEWGSTEVVHVHASGLGHVRRLSWSDHSDGLCIEADEGILYWRPDATNAAAELHGRGRALFAGDRLAIARENGDLEILDPEVQEKIRFETPHAGRIQALAWDASSARLFTAGADGSLRIWDGRTWTPGIELEPSDIVPDWLAPDPTGRYLIGGRDTGHHPHVWDLERGAPVVWLARNGIRSGAFRASGRSALLGTAWGTVVELSVDDLVDLVGEPSADDPTPDVVRMLQANNALPGGHTMRPWGLAVTRDRTWMASCSHDGAVNCWRVQDGAPELAWGLDAHADIAWSVGFDEAGARLVSTSLDVAIFDVPSGTRLATLPAQDTLVTSAGFLPDGERVVTCNLGGEVRVIDLASLDSFVLARYDEPTHQLAVDPTGRWLAVACREGSTAVWDLAHDLYEARAPDQVLRTTGSPVWAVTFRDDGRQLAVGDEAGDVTLWTPGTWRRDATLRSDSSMLRSVAFDETGDRLTAASLNQPAVIWDLRALRTELERLGLGF